jgi:hypothetical protein
MATSAGPDLVENGLVLSLDPLTSSTYPKNVHPKPTDIFGWLRDGNGFVGGCTVYKDTTIVSPAGGNPLAMYITGSDPQIVTYNSSFWNLFPAASGDTWTVSVYAKADRPVSGCQIFVFGANSSSSFVEAPASSTSLTTDWQRVSYTHTFTNANTAFIQVRLDGPDSGAIGQTIWWDGLQVENQPSMTTFDGTRTTTAAIVDRFGNVIRPVNTPGIVNDTISFDGVNDYIQLANDLWVRTSQGFAIGMWIKQGATQTLSTWNYFLRHDYRTNVLELGSYGTTGGIFSFKDNGLNAAVSTPNISTGYNYVVFGTDNNRLPYMYTVNASGTTTSTLTTPFADTEIDLRKLFGNFFSSYYKCDIKLLQVYNRALTATEVSQNFNALRSRFGI